MPAECDGIICISAGISNSHNAVEHANIDAQFAARAGFPNVIGAIDCTQIAIKVASHDEFLCHQETFSFDQCTDRMCANVNNPVRKV